MSDLISREAVIELISKYQQRSNFIDAQYKSGRLDTLRDLKRDIQHEIPAEYSVDKVIDNLKESDLYIDQEKCITVEDAIEILKAGGKDE